MMEKEKKWTVSDFYYDLPERLIAQSPSQKRDMSRLLVVDRKTEKLTDRIFSEITDYLDSQDVLVFNNSKVIPVRLLFQKNKREYEIFLLKHLQTKKRGEELWEALVRPGKKIKKGFTIGTPDDDLQITVLDFLPLKGGRLIKVEFSEDYKTIYEVLDVYGKVPLPPYIKNYQGDINRYQTVYAQIPGSSAAPTAGLHFTENILEQLRKKGVNILFVTLHVGLGTFRPVTVEDITEHKMHSEYFTVSSDVISQLQLAYKTGKNIVACGTTSVRVLETIADYIIEDKKVAKPLTGETDIFIYPGYKFKIIKKMITNFHLPHSTLLMLVSAFAGFDLIKQAYQHAVQEEYRFFSFGDGMLII